MLCMNVDVLEKRDVLEKVMQFFVHDHLDAVVKIKPV